ncbi:MAG: hypothetical protein MUC63_00330 [Planctomycetes bacterium]|nr:hypothetical protein [Planctomycetota bacterium]
MRSRIPAALLAAALVLGPALAAGGAFARAGAAEGKLGAIQAKAKGASSSRSGGGRSTGGSAGEAILAELLVEFLVRVAPLLLFPQYPFYYQAYPYQNRRGYLEYYGDSPFTAPGEVPMAARQIVFETRGGYLIDSADLHGYRAFGKVRLSHWFNVDADVTEFREWRPDSTFDRMALIKIDGLFNVSNSPVHDLDLGFGFSYLDGVDLYGGLNVKLACDVFPARPLGLHFSSCASAFEGGTLYETEAAVGLFLRNVELRVGYRAIWVEDVRIHGPMMELAVWF